MRKWTSSIPEGTCGDWRVERFTVDERGAAFHNMRCAFSPGMGRRTIDPGEYTRLKRGHTVVMSDTPAEYWDHSEAIRKATGDVVLNGLGLGLVLAEILKKPEVKSVTVIERSSEVLALVAPHFDVPRVTIIECDALKWTPPKGQRIGLAWHDIWDTISSDNLDEMKTLHRRYGRRADWQGSWCRSLCELYR